MKTRNLLITHGAVFVCGGLVAFIAIHPKAGMNGAAADASTVARGSSAHADFEQGADTRSSSQRDRHEKPPAAKAGETPSRRLEDIVRIADPLERQARLLELIDRLGPAEFAAVAEKYHDTNHFADSRGDYDIILRGWAKADPLGALDYTSKQKDNGNSMAVLLSSWAGNDAAAAERWALEHHEGKGPNPYLAAVISGLAAYDIAHASELAASMPASRERSDAVDAITRALFMQGADTAMAYPATIQDPALREGFIESVANRLAKKDAGQAATWLASLSDTDAQMHSARRVGEALAKQDSGQAADWVRKLSPEAQAEAARGVLVPMSSKDIPGTAQWVSTLNGIPNYDSVVEEFVWSCDYRSPEQSAAWIQGISDPEQRNKLYFRMLGEWAKRDADAVRNWVANNNVPPKVANRFNPQPVVH